MDCFPEGTGVGWGLAMHGRTASSTGERALGSLLNVDSHQCFGKFLAGVFTDGEINSRFLMLITHDITET